MQIFSDERLEVRARDLESNGLNGFKLVYVTLEAAPRPGYAWLDVEFQNGVALATVPAPRIFRIEGGTRRRAGAPAAGVTVTAIQKLTGNTLRLTVRPVGDYSTYVLSTVSADPNTGAPFAGPGTALSRVMDPLLNALPFKFRPGCFNINCRPDWAVSPKPPEEPAIDYLARDYDSFRHVLMTAMSRRVPGWTPTSEADLDQVLIDLIAADADEQADFHDRVMNERSIATARKRVTIARHARLMDYHVHQGNQADTWLALEVAGNVTLPPPPQDEFLVWSGPRWSDQDAVVFATSRESGRWRRRLFPVLNRLRFYTWRDTVTALAAESTEADIVGQSPFTQANAIELKDLLLGVHPGQLAVGADVSGVVDHLLIEESIKPETGVENGRDVSRRAVVRLLPPGGLRPRAEVMQDPFTTDWFVRVRWMAEDRLARSFCIVADHGAKRFDNVTLLHGNLVRITQGRPCEARFSPEDTVRPSADDLSLVLSNIATYGVVPRQGDPERPRGVLCRVPRSPLAYRDTPIGGDSPTRSTLQVEVAGVAWEEQTDLIDSEGDDEHFVVETDEMGVSVLRFGDGTNGAPLPVGATVVCRYRLGQGTSGNVGADSLASVEQDAGLVLRVWNPCDVRNGRDPEPAAEIIRRVPENHMRRQRRAVTLDDYARLAEEVEGVSHARARYAWTGSWRTVRVAIDPRGTIGTDTVLLDRVGAHLDGMRLIGEDLEIRHAEYVPLDIRMRVCAHGHYWPEDVRAALEIELSDGWTPDGRRGFFHPDAWTFGQDVWASQLIGRALAVTGVERVLRLSMRRWNPGAGGGLQAITVMPADLPESLVEVLAIGPFEIAIVANDPDHLETGRILFDIHGGRR